VELNLIASVRTRCQSRPATSLFWDMSVTLLKTAENTTKCNTGFQHCENLHTLRKLSVFQECFESVHTVECNTQSIGNSLSSTASMTLRKVSQSKTAPHCECLVTVCTIRSGLLSRQYYQHRTLLLASSLSLHTSAFKSIYSKHILWCHANTDLLLVQQVGLQCCNANKPYMVTLTVCLMNVLTVQEQVHVMGKTACQVMRLLHKYHHLINLGELLAFPGPHSLPLSSTVAQCRVLGLCQLPLNTLKASWPCLLLAS